MLVNGITLVQLLRGSVSSTSFKRPVIVLLLAVTVSSFRRGEVLLGLYRVVFRVGACSRVMSGLGLVA
jgi:hypothetical protein